MNYRDPDATIGRPDNPSAWVNRRWPFVLAISAAIIAAYLGLFEMGVTSHVWDPIFGKGSEVVLTSKVSRAFPVPDALLGSGAYLLDAVLIFAGGDARWHDLPWLVIANGIIAGILSITAVTLVLLQGFVIHSWCSLCLATAAISLILAFPIGRELISTIQFLRRGASAGQNLWPLIRGF